MSIRAMNWALAQRADGVSAQCVLYVVADTANEHGVSIYADPDYIADRTRQSRATVFRRLKELEVAGALTRLKRYRDDGAPIYEIRLHLDREINYATAPSTDDDPQDIEAKSQIETSVGSQFETGEVAQVRLGESHSCDPQKTPSKNPEDSPPNPPPGGGHAIDSELQADLEALAQAYPAPITNMPRLRTVMGAMTRDGRRKVIAGAKGYADYIRDLQRRGKTRNVKDADRWVAQGMWQGYLVAGQKLETAALTTRVSIDSEAGRAWSALHRVAAMTAFDGARTYLLPRPPDAQFLAMAQAPPFEDWMFIPGAARNQVGAWNEFLWRIFEGRTRPEFVRRCIGHKEPGFMAPWPWPPTKDGAINQGAQSTAPPDTLCTEEDLRELAEHG